MSGAAQPAATRSRRPAELPWLFSPSVDVAAFLGSALISVLALVVGHRLGALDRDTPGWAWVPFVLLLDVAHVYATGFRVYFDRQELRRRPLLYGGVPLACFLAGIPLYAAGPERFWRVLAYLAVFHFVRQQYGWVALYRSRANERQRWSWWIDAAAVYLATLYPLAYWHAHLPRAFSWFTETDFRPLPGLVAAGLAPLYWLALAAYAAKSCWTWMRGIPNPGKDLVVLTTAVCWYLGVIYYDSDYAFTVTNVIIHGVPYIVLVYWVTAGRGGSGAARHERRWGWGPLVRILSTIWLLAYLEELVWDRAIWQERSWLFGPGIDIGAADRWLVPLLAVPQLTHYVLDGFIWRRRSNPRLARQLAAPGAEPTAGSPSAPAISPHHTSGALSRTDTEPWS